MDEWLESGDEDSDSDEDEFTEKKDKKAKNSKLKYQKCIVIFTSFVVNILKLLFLSLHGRFDELLNCV